MTGPIDSIPQPFVLYLPQGLSRRLLALIDRSDSPYSDFGEFARVALENQLTLEKTRGGESYVTRASNAGGSEPMSQMSSPSAEDSGIDVWYKRPTSDAVVAVPDPPVTQNAELSPFTNRMSPFLVGTRVLASGSGSDGSMTFDTFVDRASQVARRLAFEVREMDRQSGRRRPEKWSIGWPGGEKKETSLARFQRYFLLERRGRQIVGPMIDLQLCVVEGDRVLPTTRCAAIASEPSAVFGEGAGLLTDLQMQEFLTSLLSIESERREIRDLLYVIGSTHDGMSVDDIDKSILEGHLGWSDAQATSHRAAICGRLLQLNVFEFIDVDDRSGFKVAPVGVEVLNKMRRGEWK